MAVMDLWISSRLSTNEHFVDQLRAEKMAERERRPQCLSLTRATPATRRGSARSMMTDPGHANHEAATDIPYGVRAQVPSHCRGAPMLGLHTTDKDSRSEETTPVPS